MGKCDLELVIHEEEIEFLGEEYQIIKELKAGGHAINILGCQYQVIEWDRAVNSLRGFQETTYKITANKLRKVDTPDKDIKVDRKTGFSSLELRCHDGLMSAYKAFLDMKRQHPDELRDFVDPLHRLQDLLAVRIVRRDYPEGWPTHS